MLDMLELFVYISRSIVLFSCRVDGKVTTLNIYEVPLCINFMFDRTLPQRVHGKVAGLGSKG